MNIRCCILFLLLIGPDTAWCKPEFPDTIARYHLERSYAVKTLASKHALDTIVKPVIFILQTPDVWSFGGYIELARMEGDSFAIYQLNIKASGIEAQRMNINKHGADEIVINWSLDNGHSAWSNWHYEHERGTIVLDPDSMMVLLNMETYDSEVAIWGEYKTDSTGEVQPDSIEVSDGGSSFTCGSYEFVLTKTGFTIHETANCPDQDDWEMNHYQITDNNKYEYTFTSSGYVRVK